MNRRNVFIVIVAVTILVVALINLKNLNPDPIQITVSGVLPAMSIDDKIYKSDLILIGNVGMVLPSKWNTADPVDVNSISSREIIESGLAIFTDVLIEPQIILKDAPLEDSLARVRTFTGTIENISFIGSSEPSYEQGQSYLLMLYKDDGPTQSVDPGDYIPVNAINGVYEIVGDMAISRDDEWLLDDLVAYIQSSPLSKNNISIPETPEAQNIIGTIEAAYDIEAGAAYDFNVEKFSSVFANAPLSVVDQDKLEFIRNFTGNYQLTSPGYLDYKTAYYNWWRDSSLQFDALREKAKLENRDVTQDELKAIIDSEWAARWGLASARAKSPTRELPLRVIAVDVNEQTATAYLHDGVRVVILYLIEIDGRWFISGEKDVTTRP